MVWSQFDTWAWNHWDLVSALNDDCTNVTTSSAIRFKSNASLEFDKANGSANTTLALVSYTYPAKNEEMARCGQFNANDRIGLVCYVSATTDIASFVIRLGTSASHYLSWTFADTGITAAAWNVETAALGDALITGNGWDINDIRYVAVGVNFDGETNALADIRVDHIFITRDLGSKAG